MIRINYVSLHVDDPDRALAFYTQTLGFRQKHDIPLGDGARWITVVSPAEPDGVELVLEPDDHPAAQAYKQGLVADGIPATAFVVDDIAAEHERLSAAGVTFTQPPVDVGTVIMAVLDDTCGNLIQLQQLTPEAGQAAPPT